MYGPFLVIIIIYSWFLKKKEVNYAGRRKRQRSRTGKGRAKLVRGIKGWQVTFIGLGGVIGSCYFLGLGLSIQTMGPAVLLAFVIVGIIIYAVMTAYAELLVNVPRKGSFISYTKEFLGPSMVHRNGLGVLV